MKSVSLIFSGILIVSAIAGVLVKRAATELPPEPPSRFELLGKCNLDVPENGAPGRVFVYRDNVTGAAIICFSGKTLACVVSGSKQ